MNIHPMRDRIIVRPEKEEDVTKSGLVLPQARTKNPPQIGTVLAVGPWQKDVKVGDKVVYQLFAGTEFDHDGELVLIVEAADLVAVAED